MPRPQNIKIVKASGLEEPFSLEKLHRSIVKSGLSDQYGRKIAEEVAKKVHAGNKTRDIYKSTLHILKRHSPVVAAHYSLKRSIFELGPSGHAFEDFVSRYFQAIGYNTKVCVNIQGRLVRHEVDIVGEKDGKKVFVECKFHNRLGIKNDIKIALYVKARWDDLKQGPEGKDLTAFYLASNTAFTSDAITYARGTGLSLLGMNFPEGNSFLDRISTLNLYPVTSLRRLSKKMHRDLLDRGIILARDLLQKPQELARLGLSPEDREVVLEEVHILLKDQQ